MISDQTWQRVAVGGLAALAMLVTSHGGVTGTVTTKAANGWYGSCADARVAGVTPIMRDEPGYRTELDPDNDGVACQYGAD